MFGQEALQASQHKALAFGRSRASPPPEGQAQTGGEGPLEPRLAPEKAQLETVVFCLFSPFLPFSALFCLFAAPAAPFTKASGQCFPAPGESKQNPPSPRHGEPTAAWFCAKVQARQGLFEASCSKLAGESSGTSTILGSICETRLWAVFPKFCHSLRSLNRRRQISHPSDGAETDTAQGSSTRSQIPVSVQGVQESCSKSRPEHLSLQGSSFNAICFRLLP